MKEMLNTLGVLNDNQKVSITNLVVIIFVMILGFKMMFAGVKVDTKLFDWEIIAPDIANTLPLLFSLLNYSHKRLEINKSSPTQEEHVK